jgi:hypothetical protein
LRQIRPRGLLQRGDCGSVDGACAAIFAAPLYPE